jgi:hypothetical protein
MVPKSRPGWLSAWAAQWTHVATTCKRLGRSTSVPRPQHEESDEAEQAAFKKPPEDLTRPRQAYPEALESGRAPDRPQTHPAPRVGQKRDESASRGPTTLPVDVSVWLCAAREWKGQLVAPAHGQYPGLFSRFGRSLMSRSPIGSSVHLMSSKTFRPSVVAGSKLILRSFVDRPPFIGGLL